ncbi:MAG: hypothetical protein N2C14_06305, partial [Planctomycetales bacterium]
MMNATANESNAVELVQEGHWAFLSPPCDEIVDLLNTFRHVLGERRRVTKRPEPLLALKHPEHLRFPAGLIPVVKHVLAQHGYQVNHRATLKPLPLPAPTPIQGNVSQPQDEALVDFLQRVERGLIRLGRGAWAVRLIAQAALAFPSARIAVACASRDEVHETASLLNKYIPNVAFVDVNTPEELAPRRVVVATPLRLDESRVGERELMFALNARLATSILAANSLPHCGKSRLFGFLAPHEKPAPLDLDLMAALFGFEELAIPDHGCVIRPARVVMERMKRAGRVNNPQNIVDLKQRGIWENGVRNRLLCKLARLLTRDDRDQLRELFPKTAEAAQGMETSNVVVLVENEPHAARLRTMSPGVALMTLD